MKSSSAHSPTKKCVPMSAGQETFQDESLATLSFSLLYARQIHLHLPPPKKTIADHPANRAGLGQGAATWGGAAATRRSAAARRRRRPHRRPPSPSRQTTPRCPTRPLPTPSTRPHRPARRPHRRRWDRRSGAAGWPLDGHRPRRRAGSPTPPPPGRRRRWTWGPGGRGPGRRGGRGPTGGSRGRPGGGWGGRGGGRGGWRGGWPG